MAGLKDSGCIFPLIMIFLPLTMEAKNRVFPRVVVKITIKQVGSAVNISEGGLCIISDNPLPVGQVINLDLSLSGESGNPIQESSDPVKYEGIVVRNKFSALLNKFEVGVKFINSSPSNKEQIKSFIESHI